MPADAPQHVTAGLPAVDAEPTSEIDDGPVTNVGRLIAMAAGGASIGAIFGPEGAVFGAVVGGILGVLGLAERHENVS